MHLGWGPARVLGLVVLVVGVGGLVVGVGLLGLQAPAFVTWGNL